MGDVKLDQGRDYAEQLEDLLDDIKDFEAWVVEVGERGAPIGISGDAHSCAIAMYLVDKAGDNPRVGGDLQFDGETYDWDGWMDQFISRFDRKAPHGVEVYAPAVLEVIEEIKAAGPRSVTVSPEGETECDGCGYHPDSCECCGECEQGPSECDCFYCAECDGKYRNYNYNCDEETSEALCDDCFSDRTREREEAAADAAVEVE